LFSFYAVAVAVSSASSEALELLDYSFSTQSAFVVIVVIVVIVVGPINYDFAVFHRRSFFLPLLSFGATYLVSPQTPN
jgi:hypothetical protein